MFLVVFHLYYGQGVDETYLMCRNKADFVDKMVQFFDENLKRCGDAGAFTWDLIHVFEVETGVRLGSEQDALRPGDCVNLLNDCFDEEEGEFMSGGAARPRVIKAIEHVAGELVDWKPEKPCAADLFAVQFYKERASEYILVRAPALEPLKEELRSAGVRFLYITKLSNDRAVYSGNIDDYERK